MGKLTKSFKKNQIRNFIESIISNNEIYYLFASGATPYSNESVADGVLESYDKIEFTPKHEMMFGKRILEENVQYLTKRYDWTTNTVFAQYDNRDISIFNKNFYTITDENKVYKCLYNNRMSPSTIKPTLTINTAFKTSDLYIWKYLFTLSSQDISKFATTEYIPVIANTNVVNSAEDGIDVIEIIAGGTGYISSLNGKILSIQPNSQIIQIDSYAQSDNNFYKNCNIYISEGPAAGALRKITAYTVNSSGNWITVNNAIVGLTPQTSKYQINPAVEIVGDGIGALAIASVNTTITGYLSTITILAGGTGYSNGDQLIFTGSCITPANATLVTNSTGGVVSFNFSNTGVGYTRPPVITINTLTGVSAQLKSELGGYPISNVTIIATGTGYTYANVTIKDNQFGTGANLVAYAPPIGGHGFEPIGELGSDAIGVYMEFANNENGDFRTDLSFRSYGILNNPIDISTNTTLYTVNTFNQIQVANISPSVVFSPGEKLLGGDTNSVVIVVSANATTVAFVGDYDLNPSDILISANTNSNTFITSITKGDIKPYSGEILYINNVIPIQRSNTTTETFKLVINL